MEPQPTLDQLQIFLAVIGEGSFSAAGRRLGRAQSAISYAIGNLEAQLGLALFDRAATRQPRPTAAGLALATDARCMVASLQALRARAHGLRQGLEAEVRLAVDVLLPAPVLAAVLKAFQAEFPTVGLRLHTGVLGAVWDQLLQGQADLGIAGEMEGHRHDLSVRRLGGATIVPVATPEHPLARLPGPVPATAVREHLQIVVTDQTEHTKGRDFRVIGLTHWRVTDMATKHALVCAGLGWGGLPHWMATADIAAGRLKALDLEPYPPTPYRLNALWPAAAPPGPAVTWLAEEVRQALEVFTADGSDGADA